MNPCKLVYYDEHDNIMSIRYFDENGLLHRCDGPAILHNNKLGEKYIEEYYYHGLLHREGDLPAVIRYFGNGCVDMEEYHKFDIRIRDIGPATVFYHQTSDETKRVKCEIYYRSETIDDFMMNNTTVSGSIIHRDNDLPAEIVYDENGNVIKERWFMNGICFKETWRDV